MRQSTPERQVVGNPRRPAQPASQSPQPAERRSASRQPAQPSSRQAAPVPAQVPQQKRAQPPELRQAEQQEGVQFVRVYTGVDRPFLILVLTLLAFGVIMGFSAGYSYASYEYGDALHFFKNNLVFAVAGLLAMGIGLSVHLEGIRVLAIPAYIFGIVLLVLVLIPGIGIAEGDARRWIPIPPFGTFQPSELAKLTMVMMMARHLSLHQDKITDFSGKGHPFAWGFLASGAWMAIVAGLVAAEHHISGTLIIAGIGIIMMFVGRVRLRYFFIAAALLVGAAVLLITVSNYGMTRIEVWKMVLFDPLNIPKEIRQDSAYQNLQGLYAIGSGGIFGTGLGNSFQKYGFVSQPQNDFIFSIICEELGFIGALAVILLFAALGWRGYVIARNAPDLYSSLVVTGITVQVVLQAFLNICVVTALIPNTGISLPFFSSGGSSLCVLMLEMGIVLSISRYSYQKRT